MILVGIALSGQGVINAAGWRWMTPYDGPIAFVDQALLELPAEQAGGLDVQAEEQNARGAAVKSVSRPDALADLIAQDLDRKACFVAIDFRAMDKQVGRLVDDDDMLVAKKNGQGFRQRSDSLLRRR